MHLHDVLTLIYPPLDLGKPSKEQLALQMELQRQQRAHKLDEEEFDNQKQVLQAQLQSEVSPITASCWVWETMRSAFYVMRICLTLGGFLV